MFQVLAAHMVGMLGRFIILSVWQVKYLLLSYFPQKKSAFTTNLEKWSRLFKVLDKVGNAEKSYVLMKEKSRLAPPRDRRRAKSNGGMQEILFVIAACYCYRLNWNGHWGERDIRDDRQDDTYAYFQGRQHSYLYIP